MILRKAKLNDFEVFKKLYEDKEDLYHWIYMGPLVKFTPKASTRRYELVFDKSDFDYFKNYTIENFKKDLNSNLIYMIEDSSEIIGYISMFYCCDGKYKITEWAMFNPDDEDKKIEVLNCLKKLKLPRLKMFFINTLSENPIKFFLANGFSYPRKYEIEIKI